MSADVRTAGPMLVNFVAGASGEWAMNRVIPIVGEPLGVGSDRLRIAVGPIASTPGSWVLRGIVSHVRYTTKDEAVTLTEKQPALGRPEATRAALIPIRKSAAWWALAQDERRAIYEERSKHTSIGLQYLPRIARRLHHSRDIGEPFDFLTWFEFAPEHEAAFIELLGRLRRTEEWRYVEREVEVWVERD